MTYRTEEGRHQIVLALLRGVEGPVGVDTPAASRRPADRSTADPRCVDCGIFTVRLLCRRCKHRRNNRPKE